MTVDDKYWWTLAYMDRKGDWKAKQTRIDEKTYRTYKEKETTIIRVRY